MRKRKLFIIILILVLLLAFSSFIIIHAANNDDVFNTIKNNIESYYNNLNNNHKLKVSINNNDIANTKNIISQYQDTINGFKDTDSIHDIYTTLQSIITDGSAKPNIITGYINIKRTMDNLFEVSTQESDITVKDNNGIIYKYTPLDKDLEGNYSALNKDIAVYKPQTQFLSTARKVKEHIENLVLLYSVTNDQKYFDAIKLEMFNAIDWKNYWQSTQFVDTAEIAYAVSLGYDFTYNNLTSEEKCKIENKLLYSIMLFNTKSYADSVNSSKGNFNQVAHSGMGIVSLTLIDSSNEGKINVTSIDTNKKTISIEYPVKSIKNGSLSIEYNNGLIIRKNADGEYVTYDAQITDSEMYDLIVNYNLIKEDSNGNKYITLRHFYTAVIAKTVEFLPKVLKSDNTYIDGSYPEGKDYYLYGMRYFSYYLATLQNTLKKDYDLLNFETYNDKNRVVFDNIVLNPVYISNAKGINLAYGDARNNAHDFEGDLFYLADLNAKKTNRNTIANVIYDYRKRTYGTWNFYSILWYNENYDIEKIDNIEYDRIFNVKIYQNDIVKKNINRLGVSAFRKSFTDSNSIFVAMRGGDTKANHTHLDLGSYIFEALGTRWINDDGSGPYDGKKYHDKEYLRWQYYSARAESHSTIVINKPTTINTDNTDVKKGTCLHADQWVNAYAEFELFESSENSNIAKINLTDAYNKNNNDDIKIENLENNTNSNEVHRGIKLFNNKRYMLVQDEVSLENVKEYYSFLNIDKTKDKATNKYKITVDISEDGKEATLTDDKGNIVKLYLKSDNDKVKFKMIDEITNGTGLLNNFIGNPDNNTNVNLEKNNDEKYMNHNKLVVYLDNKDNNGNPSSVNMKVGVFFVPQYNDGTDISQSMLRLNSLSKWYIPQKPEIKIYSGDTEINNQGSAYNSAIIKINTQDEIQSNEILKYSLDNGTNWYLYDDNNEEDVQRRTISQIGNNTINVLAILDDGFGVESDTARLSDFSFDIIENKKLDGIVISSPPTKTSYIEGENFDASGMEVTATYDNGTTNIITNYEITDGNNLTSDKTSVTISYTEDGVTKTTTQEITVSKKILSSIEVTTPPSKTTYIEGQNFDPSGMKIATTYNDGSTKEVTNYTITDGNNLTSDKTSVTISYTEDDVTKTTTQEITVSKKILSSIEVSTPPTKTSYIEGENFDASGMEVTATYDNGTTNIITNYEITDGNNLTSDKTSVTIGYAEAGVTKITTQEITVSKKILSSIEVTTPPTKTSYIEGENFDASGMEVTATYDNGTTNIITNYETTDGNNLTSDKTSITISYTENGVTKTTTQEITVIKKILSSIEVTTPPIKTIYIEGQNFDPAGMKIAATYNNGTTKEVTNYTITDGNNLTSDKTSITISYTENGVTKTTTQKITVKNPLSSIEVTTPPSRTTYIEGQNFDSAGMKIAATYNDGSTKEVTNYTITDGNNLTLDKTSVTISYTEDDVTKTTTQEVTVSKKILSSIEVTTPPSKTTYIEGQNFDSAGMKVTATYNNGSTKEVTNYTITDGNNLTSDKTSVTISYTEDDVTKTTTQEITVSKKLLTSIEVTTPPTKTSYIEGENFDASGMEVTATYDNGTTNIITNYEITDGNNLTSDKTSVTISYTEDGVTKTTTQKITVKNPLSSIEVTTPPSKTTYIEGQNFDPAGMKVTATYDNGTTNIITNYEITDGNNLTSDKTSVTISYTEDGVTKTTIQEITVSKKILSSIEVSTPPIKTTYIDGQNFDPSGMKIAATYNNGSTKEVTNYTITDGNNLTLDKTSVTISYTENGVTKTTTQKITVKNPLSSIKVTTPPSRTTYIEGQNFDSAGMKIAATYNNGSTKEVTNYTITDGNNLTSDKTSVTISYTEDGVTKTTIQEITVSKKILNGIEVSTPPTKISYIEGENFDASGMEVTATYDNGTTNIITNYEITDGNNLTSDKTSVTISYTEDGVTKTTIQEIIVSKKMLSSIEVTTPPSKTTYIEGQNFDPAGMKIAATYNNGSTKEVTNYTITDGNNLTSDKTSVTISYTENGVTKTTTQKITVKNTLSSIEVKTPPSKTTYIEGQNFDPAGMKIAATYNNGSTKEVTNYTITDGNNLTSDKTSVTISYTEDGVTKTTTQEITVSKKALSSIEVSTPPSKTTYIEGQNFDPAGMKIAATYNDGSTKEVTNYTITDGNNLTSDKTSVTISYTEDDVTKTTTQEITVSKKILSSIEVSTPPSKTTYIEGQNFDPAGMKIAATYNDGSTKEVTNYTITDGNNLTSDKTSVTISYTEDDVTKTTTQEITVSKKILSSIEVSTPPTKTSYIEGENFDASGMEVTATYDNGTTNIITNYEITDGNNLTSDKTSVTISYTEDGVTKTTTQEITVSKKILSSIEVSTPPTKTSYIEGENFDPSGMKIAATYNNGSTKEVTNYTITDGNSLTSDKTSVTISYTEDGVTKTTKQEITVIKKLKISFVEYNEVNKDGVKYIDNIAPNTTIEEMIEHIETNGTIKVYKGNEEITDKKIKTSTGMKVKISLNNENYEYTTVVKGDTNGDGESNLRDLLQVNKHRLNKSLLTAEYLLAGDVNKDNEVNLRDLLQMNKYRLGKINTL